MKSIAYPLSKIFSNLDNFLKKHSKSTIFSSVEKVFKYLVSKWFFIGLACFIALAHSYPNATANVHIDYWAVAIIFLISGMSINTKELFLNMCNWRAHTTVLSCSFLITSSTVFGICTGIKAANNGKISNWMLVGLIVTHTCPTTVASNVVMTKQADGNVALCLCEVVIGNMLGAFITPALCQLYFQGTWQFANPANASGVGEVYKHVVKQIGLSVFLPMFVGQVLQNTFSKIVKWSLEMFILNKVATFMLLLVMWSSFCTAFRQNAFTSVSHASIIMIVFFNVGTYLLFTVICFLYSRPSFLLKIFAEPPCKESTFTYKWSYKSLKPFYYNRTDTVTVMLCGPAKTAALGVSLITSQYGLNDSELGKLLVPLVLYQAEQVFCAGLLTSFMKKWVHAEDEEFGSDIELDVDSIGPIEPDKFTV